MAISPRCDRCGEELVRFGAILFSPPNTKSEVIKWHLCVPCYDDTIKDMKSHKIRSAIEVKDGAAMVEGLKNKPE